MTVEEESQQDATKLSDGGLVDALRERGHVEAANALAQKLNAAAAVRGADVMNDQIRRAAGRRVDEEEGG